MRLYHFTSSYHWPEIKASGVLKVTESNVSDRRAHAGPDVVWLTDDPRPENHRWGLARDATLTAREIFQVYGPISRTTSMLLQELRDGKVRIFCPNKTDIRVEVEVSDAEPYPQWARDRGIRNMWYRALACAGNPERWFVIERPIPREEWVEAVETATGAILALDVSVGVA